DDFVDAAVRLSECVANEVINVGAGEEHSIRHFAELICRHVGYDFDQIEFDTSRYVGARSKFLDVRKLQRYLPAFKRTPLAAGLATTIDWFRKHALGPASVAA
ncbi:MAG TPA: hypothetical protein VGX78_19645, partial [Pirellulales bacterium]|nr:hypothetical protein [Pirellulales bacterium]